MAESLKDLIFDASKNSGGGSASILISTGNVEVAKEVWRTVPKLGEAARDVFKTVTTLGALYTGYKLIKPLIDVAVKRALGGERDDQEVRLEERFDTHCLTDERYLEVLGDYESGRMKERLQEEFSQVGIKVEGLKVEIENMVEVNETKESIKKRYSRCFMKMFSDLAKSLV